jgi:hypothetical protein
MADGVGVDAVTAADSCSASPNAAGGELALAVS